jgi:tagatose-6-phosphate ketose/aldose isomerase
VVEVKLFNMEQELLVAAKGHITALEIMQQPELWQHTVGIMENNKTRIQTFLTKALEEKNVRIVITGAGTSAYVGDIVAPYLRRILGLRVESVATTDLVSNPEDYFERDTPTILISCARSGNSPESVATYNLAESLIDTLYQVVITCNKEGDLAQKVKGKDNNLLVLMPEASNDKGFAMTGSFSCMVITLLMMFDLNRFNENKVVVQEIINCGKDILQNEAKVLQTIVANGCKRIVYLGSSVLSALAQEAALKTLELSSGKVVVLSESVLGFRHGPKSIMDDQTVVFVFLSNQPYTRQYDVDLLKELHREKGNYKIAAISYIPDKEIAGLADYVFIVNKEAVSNMEDAYAGMVYILYAQMYAFLNSLALGITPDNPRSDGTVNRVVQGVNIYSYDK